jgi:hypothetical protein
VALVLSLLILLPLLMRVPRWLLVLVLVPHWLLLLQCRRRLRECSRRRGLGRVASERRQWSDVNAVNAAAADAVTADATADAAVTVADAAAVTAVPIPAAAAVDRTGCLLVVSVRLRPPPPLVCLVYVAALAPAPHPWVTASFTLSPTFNAAPAPAG